MLSVVAESTSGVTGTWLVITTTITALGVIGAAVVAFFDRRGAFKRERDDALLTYKRNIYRNFLDHAYWYRSEALSPQERQKRAEKYVADWHRIQLIAGPKVRNVTATWMEQGSLAPQDDEVLIAAFKEDLGLGGIE